MSFVVARMQKMKAGNLVGIGNHNQRRTDNHSNRDIDPERKHLNYDLVQGRTNNYKTDIQKFIKNKKSTKRATRKDAVLVNEWIITSDKPFFDRLDAHQKKKFFEASKDYFADKFGDDNIRYAQVHRDETTPHMHLGVIPFDKDKKLSAKRVFGRQTLQAIQDDFPVFLQEQGFDIERGQKGSERNNLTVPEYKSMKQDVKELSENKETLSDEVSELENDYEKYQAVIDTVEDIDVESEPVMEKKGFLNREEIETGQVIVSKGDFERLHKAYRYVPTLKSELTTAKKAELAQREEKSQIRDERDFFKQGYNKVSEQIEKAMNIIKRLDEFLEEKLGISAKSVINSRSKEKEPDQDQSQEKPRGR